MAAGQLFRRSFPVSLALVTAVWCLLLLPADWRSWRWHFLPKQFPSSLHHHESMNNNRNSQLGFLWKDASWRSPATISYITSVFTYYQRLNYHLTQLDGFNQFASFTVSKNPPCGWWIRTIPFSRSSSSFLSVITYRFYRQEAGPDHCITKNVPQNLGLKPLFITDYLPSASSLNHRTLDFGSQIKWPLSILELHYLLYVCVGIRCIARFCRQRAHYRGTMSKINGFRCVISSVINATPPPALKSD